MMMKKCLTILVACLISFSSIMMMGEDEDAMAKPGRAVPTLTGGGVHTKSPEPIKGNFTFHVTYTDTDGQAPLYGLIYLMLENTSHYMSSNGTSYSTGVNYTVTVTNLESGDHYYYFSTMRRDGNGSVYLPSDPQQNKFKFTVAGNVSTPSIVNIGMDPEVPGIGQTINFTCTYRDRQGHDPEYVQIAFDGGQWTNMSVSGSDAKSGLECYYQRTFNSYSGHNYRIRAKDITDLSFKTRLHYFNVKNAHPQVISGGVDPASGEAHKTNFTFFLKMKDWEGDEPTNIRVDYQYMDDQPGNSTYFSSYLSAKNGPYNRTQMKQGANFTRSLRLMTGDYRFNFYFLANYTWLRYPNYGYLMLNTTGWRHPPTLSNLSFSPSTGDENTVFNISLTYTDPDGSDPDHINMSYAGINKPFSVHGSDHRNGTVCSVNTRLSMGREWIIAYGEDEQGLKSNNLCSNKLLTVKGSGPPGRLRNGWVSPNPGIASDYQRYEFTVDYDNPYGNNIWNNTAREVELILDNISYHMYPRQAISNSTLRYGTDLYYLQAGTYSYHMEGLDYGFREMRYPETGELTLTVFEDAPTINYGFMSPWEGSDLDDYQFNLSVEKRWNGTNSSKTPYAYVVIDGVEHSMTNMGSTGNWSGEIMFHLELELSAGLHRIHFKAEYKNEGYTFYPPDEKDFYSVFIEGHNELNGRKLLPIGPNNDDILNFTIVYTDTGDLDADHMRLFIDNEVHNMTRAPGNVSAGLTYYFRTRLCAGNHTYWFEAVGRNRSIRSPSMGNYYTVYVSEKKMVNYPILMNCTHAPSTGDNTTTFRFRTSYRHPGGLAPGHVRVVIDGGEHNMKGDPSTDYISGVDHTYSTRLSRGQHVYYFTASDSEGREVRYPPADVLTLKVEGKEENKGSGTPPVASIAYTRGKLKASLDGSSSHDPDGSIVFHYWVIEGESYQGKRINVTFDDPGYVTVTLTVTDDDGMSDVATVRFWVTSSGGSSQNENLVGGVVEVSESGQGTLRDMEEGTSISIEEVGEKGISFSLNSTSNDPRVLVLDVNREAVSLSYGEDLGLRIDGEDVKMASSLEDVINGEGDTPLYHMVRSGDSYKVMVYLPDPSDVEKIDVVVTGGIDTGDEASDEGTQNIFMAVMIVLSLVLTLVVVILLLTRRGPSYDRSDYIEEDQEEDYEEDMDFDMISASRRETYRQLLEE